MFGKQEPYKSGETTSVNINPGVKQSGTIELGSDEKVSKITLRSRVLSSKSVEKLASEHPQIIIDGKNTKPNSFSNITDGQEVKLEGTIFTVPTGMKDLLADGWKTEDHKENDIVSGNTTLVRLQKNDTKIEVFATDKSEPNVKFKDLVVYQIILKSSDNTKTEFVGNVTTNSTLDEIKAVFGDKELSNGINGIKLLEYVDKEPSSLDVNGYVFVIGDDNKASEIRLYGDADFYFAK